MPPAVPFALLGVVQMLAIAGWIGLAGAALFPRLRRRTTPALVIGLVLLALADVTVAFSFGDPSSTSIAWLRVGGLLLTAVGVSGGAAQTLQLSTGVTAGVVVPLGAAPLAAYAGGFAGVVAAVAAWRRGRRPGADPVAGAALALAFLLTGVAASLAAPATSSSSAAVAELAVRAVATAAVAVALVQLARTMLMGKLAGAILVGVAAMAAGAVGVVGTGVADEVQTQQVNRLAEVAKAEQDSLRGASLTRASLFAQVVARCPQQTKTCVRFLSVFAEAPEFFAVQVYPGGARDAGSDLKAPLSNAALVQIAGSDSVRRALLPGTPSTAALGGPVLLPGAPPTLAVIAASPGRPGGVTDARVKPTFVAVYGLVVNDDFLGSLKRDTGYDYSVVADGTVLASTVTGPARADLLQAERTVGADTADVDARQVVSANGRTPVAVFVSLPEAGNDEVRLATLAVSQPAAEALRAQRSVLRRMFETALVALLLAVLLALLLARRIADPVRRLTIAAGRVRRGDLDTTTSVSGRDEVGSLARAFEAMTASLRSATGELRTAAEQEAALRERLETVVESMSDGLVVTDADDTVTSVNVTAARLLGIDAQEANGRPVGEVLTVQDDDGRSLLEGAADRRTVDGVVTCGDGRSVPVRFSAAPLADRQGRVIVLADRTREHEVERMKTEFLSNVSHELRTPLTPIRGYAELLARRSDLARPQVETFLQEILGSTARMSRVVELLVDVAALEGNRVAADVTRVPVRGLVDDRLEAWRAAYPERAKDLRRRVAAKVPPVAIDARWVKRALDEFVDNAVKYTPAGTPITFVVSTADGPAGRVRLAVRDAGPGFDAAVAAELVGDFSQADASETRRVGGLGLGLGFVNRVAQRFGLDLVVDATPGKGAEFALLVPAWTGTQPRGE